MKKPIVILTIISPLILLAAASYMFRLVDKDDAAFNVQRPDRIVLVTIDTLRADHLSCYGYPRKTSPFIDSMAKDGVLFKRLISSVSLTAPAHASIFTALYPLQHNLLRNGQKLNPSFLTMAELLKATGYQTAGFVATDMHFMVGNMDQGFDFLSEPVIKRDIRPRGRRQGDSVDRDPETPIAARPVYRQADATITQVLKWLEARQPEENFFLWIHLYDPHMPYAPPQQFLETLQQQSEEDERAFAAFLFNQHHINFPDFIKEPHKIPSTINNYDAEIMFVDSQIERLYFSMQQKGLDANTLWIITADHGEGLGGHKFLTHGKLIYNEQIHIPLIFHFTFGADKGLAVEEVVEQVDILPTIAELVGADLSGQSEPVEGTSLLSLIKKDHRAFAAKYAFAHKWAKDPDDLPEFVKQRNAARKAYVKKRREEMRKAGDLGKRPTRRILSQEEEKSFREEKFAFLNREYKYILNTTRDDEFYNLLKDPYEVDNLAGTGSMAEKMLRTALLLKVKRLSQNGAAKSESVDQETIQKLKSLGYMQ